MESDPTRIEPDDATPNDDSDAEGAPAPFETPDEDPQPIEETDDAPS